MHCNFILLPLRVVLSLSLLAANQWALASDSTTYQVDGLSAEAEIIVDQYGVPHIYANDHYDVFFVQGFNAARDRLWQIDLWKRRGLGQLAEILGASYVDQDKAARMFVYRGDMYAEWLAYGNDAKRIAESFTAGINAFIKVAKANADLMPVEFGLLGYQPSQWHADDVVRIRSNGLWRNVVTEVWRAQLACADQAELAARWLKLEPTWQTQTPAGLDPCVIPDNVLDNYLLATASVNFDDLSPPQRMAKALTKAKRDAHKLDVGSNNWVVTGSRTTTGRPILADDPHRSHAVPSLRYVAHLNGPGINVIGAGEPALPGISIGHNDKIAFGLTIFPIDQEDLYVYEKKRGGYLYQGDVEPFTQRGETVAVKNGKAQSVTLKFTRHGPVIAETKKHAFSVRAAWLQPGMAPYFGSIEYMRAENFREFVGALNRWGAPSENQVYADIDGNIGYKPAGRFPKRDNWDGLMPVPGDGSYEWDGYFDMDVLPEEYNPERGFRHEIDGGCSPAGMSNASIEELRRFNLTVAQTYCYLSNDTQLAPAALRSMNAAFATLRRAGVKALWRFAYDRAMPGTHVYTEDTILGHIDQLAAPFAQHHDALYVLQAGFIGSWGEWHSSMTNLHANKTAVSNIVEAELFSLLPADRKINVRVPVYKLSGVLRRPAGQPVLAAHRGYGGLGTAGTPLTARELDRWERRFARSLEDLELLLSSPGAGPFVGGSCFVAGAGRSRR